MTTRQYISLPRKLEVAFELLNSGNAKSILHFDSDFTDELGKVWTAVGNAQISSTLPKIGAGAVLFDGVADYIWTPDHVDFARGTGDYTIAGWIKTVQTAQAVVFYQGDSNGGYSSVAYLSHINRPSNSGKFSWCPDYIRWISGGHHWLDSLTSINDGNWHHIACVRYGDVFTLYIDGVAEATVTLVGFSTTDSGEVFTIGCMPAPNYYNAFAGRVDEFAFFANAQWTENFTPPITPFEKSSGVAIPRKLEVMYHTTTDIDLTNPTGANADTVEWNYSWGNFYTNAILTGYSSYSGDYFATIFRFPNVAVPQGANIISATLYVTSADTRYAGYPFNTYYYNGDNAPQPINMGVGLTILGSSVLISSWLMSVAGYNHPGDIYSKDVTAAVQSIVDRAGWASGNAMAFSLYGVDWTGLIGPAPTNGFVGYPHSYAQRPYIEMTYRAANVYLSEPRKLEIAVPY